MDIKSQPEILVSGATGGVGSVAIQFLRKIGYENITAIVRKANRNRKKIRCKTSNNN